MKNRRKQQPLLGQILQEIAPRIGAQVLIEPTWKIVGQITYQSGKRRYFRYSSLDLNPLGASEIAKDKDYATFFMARMGYPTVPGSKTFYSNEWARAIGARGRGIDDAYRYAQKLGFPVVVKPNSGSQGMGVALVHTKQEFYRALRAIFKRDKIALVQKQVRGRDYRLVVLDDRVISAYERIPLSVVGDGVSSILRLLKDKQRRFVADGRDTSIKMDDPRIYAKLKRQGLTLRSVPAEGERVYLLDNANLSTGGDAVDMTENALPFFKQFAVKLAKDMGLRLCGVDLMVQDAATSASHGPFWVLEINAAPGLDHYAKAGRAQEIIVENLYLEVLKSMEK